MPAFENSPFWRDLQRESPALALQRFRLGSKPAVLATESHFRFAPQSRHLKRTLDSSVWANQRHHSIT
jgi:hypothetical protein